MMKILPMERQDVIGFRISGKVHSRDVEHAITQVKDCRFDNKNVRLYIEVGSFAGMTYKAFLKDIKWAVKHYREFDREVIVSNKKWLEVMVNLIDRLVPDLELRHYRWRQRNRAESWICS